MVIGTGALIKDKGFTSETFTFFSNPFNDLIKEKKEVFIWGNGVYQAKPGVVPNFINFSPKKQLFSLDKKKAKYGVPDIVDIEASDKLLICLDSKGNIWSCDNKQIWSAKKDSNLPSFKIKSIDKSGIAKNQVIHSQNFISNLQNINGKGKTTSIKIVLENVYALNHKGKLFRSKLDKIQNGSPDWKEIKTVKNVKQIDGGVRHLLMLDNDGNVFAMGDDTFGQCGSGDDKRNYWGPFSKKIIRNPQKIEGLDGQIVDKIFAGGSHNFAMTNSGQVFGWGSNNLMQLGHEDEFSVSQNPRLAFFAPVNFGYFFKEQKVKDIAVGLDFSLFICENNETGLTEVFGMGHNKEGQLASGFPKHIQKLRKLEPLSDFDIASKDGGREPLKLEISCGNKHCLAKTSNQCLLIWGANQEGQLGNMKRSFSSNPILMSKFNKKEINHFKAFGNQTFININTD
jgi:alpha-tubulin suppressor-like RCC1 family protein